MARSKRVEQRNHTSVEKLKDLRSAAEARTSGGDAQLASRTSKARQTLDEARIAARMLGDVITFLQTQDRAVRATNVFSTLPEVIALPPTERQLLIDWNKPERRQAEILAALDAAKEAFEVLTAAADPDQNRERELGPWFDHGYGYQRLRGRSSYSYRKDAMAALSTLTPKLLAVIPAEHPQPWVRALYRTAKDWALMVEEIAQRIENIGASPQEDEDFSAERSQLEALLETLDQTLGGARGAWRSPLAENQAPRNLPQLYELWVLCVLLDAAGRAGHVVTLLAPPGGAAGETWAIKYAQAQAPVAKLDDVYVFFQLKDNDKGAMPDIGLWPTAQSTTSALAIFDPKYSEAGGYSLADYQKTVDTYADLFDAPITAVVEFHDRTDLAPVSDPRILLGMRPEAPGRHQFEALVFGAMAQKTPGVAVLDVSPSFQAQIAQSVQVIERLRQHNALEDRFFTFDVLASQHADWRKDKDQALKSGVGSSFKAMSDLLVAQVPETTPILLFSDETYEDAAKIDELIRAGYKIWRFSFS